MCTGQCSRCIAVNLYPLAVISILCNILLFFPGWDVKYVKDGRITEEVKYMGGLVGGGLMVSFYFLSGLFAKGCDSGLPAGVNAILQCNVQTLRQWFVIIVCSAKPEKYWFYKVDFTWFAVASFGFQISSSVDF